MNYNNKKVGITGPFGDINFGDYAMLVNNIYDFNSNDITLFSYNDKFLDLIKEEYLDDYDIDILSVKLKNESEKISVDSNLTPVEIINLSNNYNLLFEKVKNLDILVVNGGGYFNGLWSQPHRIDKLIKIIIPILIANQLNIKIIFTGNSFGPFGKDKEFFAGIFNSLKNIEFMCRDDLYSPMWLKQSGIKYNKINYLPDDLFFVNDKILDKETTYEMPVDKYIVMESYLHMDYFEKNIDKIKKFTNKIYEKYRLKTLFLPFDLSFGGMKQGRYLNSQLKHFDIYDISRKGYLPLQDAIKIIKNSELVISTRYHALILALSNKIPGVNVLRDVMGDKRYYYNKSSGILRKVFKNIYYNEKYYLGLDYVETLNFVTENYDDIVEHQLSNYNNQFEKNKNKLQEIRTNYINKIFKK